MNIDSIRDGIVIDHITAGKGMRLYELLGLNRLDSPVAIIKNAVSKRLGKKDIIKIDGEVAIDFDVIGYVDPGATVNIIKDGVLLEKKSVPMPEKLVGVLRCRNPRCITTTEQEIPQIFRLTKDRYRCVYCETGFIESPEPE